MTDDNNKDKYKIKEVEKFNDIKKRIDSKISDIYAYFNRKEFRKKIKDKEKNDAYELYLKDINHLFMWHGRDCCTARNPNCNNCPVASYCRSQN